MGLYFEASLQQQMRSNQSQEWDSAMRRNEKNMKADSMDLETCIAGAVYIVEGCQFAEGVCVQEECNLRRKEKASKIGTQRTECSSSAHSHPNDMRDDPTAGESGARFHVSRLSTA